MRPSLSRSSPPAGDQPEMEGTPISSEDVCGISFLSSERVQKALASGSTPLPPFCFSTKGDPNPRRLERPSRIK